MKTEKVRTLISLGVWTKLWPAHDMNLQLTLWLIFFESSGYPLIGLGHWVNSPSMKISRNKNTSKVVSFFDSTICDIVSRVILIKCDLLIY